MGAGGLGSPVASVSCRRRRGHADDLRRRHGRSHQSAAPDRASHRGDRHAKAASAQRTLVGINPGIDGARRQRSASLARDSTSSCATPTSSSTAATISRRATHSTAHVSRTRKPLVSGAGVRFDGQIAVFDRRDAACALLSLPVSGDRRRTKTCAAPSWACLRRWSASSARCRPRKR